MGNKPFLSAKIRKKRVTIKHFWQNTKTAPGFIARPPYGFFSCSTAPSAGRIYAGPPTCNQKADKHSSYLPATFPSVSSSFHNNNPLAINMYTG